MNERERIHIISFGRIVCATEYQSADGIEGYLLFVGGAGFVCVSDFDVIFFYARLDIHFVGIQPAFIRHYAELDSARRLRTVDYYSESVYAFFDGNSLFRLIVVALEPPAAPTDVRRLVFKRIIAVVTPFG